MSKKQNLDRLIELKKEKRKTLNIAQNNYFHKVNLGRKVFKMETWEICLQLICQTIRRVSYKNISKTKRKDNTDNLQIILKLI